MTFMLEVESPPSHDLTGGSGMARLSHQLPLGVSDSVVFTTDPRPRPPLLRHPRRPGLVGDRCLRHRPPRHRPQHPTGHHHHHYHQIHCLHCLPTLRPRMAPGFPSETTRSSVPETSWAVTSSRHRPPTTTATTTWRTASEVHTQRCPGSCYPPLLAGGLGGARTGNLGSGLGASRTGHRAQRDVVVVIRTPFRLRRRRGLRLRPGHRHRLRVRPGVRAAALLPNAEYGHSSLLRGLRWDRAGWLGCEVGCLLRRAFALKRRMAFASFLLRGGDGQAILGLTTSSSC